MIRFSQRGWNNIIIFSMLLLVLLFQTGTNIFDHESEPDKRLLLPAEGVVMTIDFAQHRVERIGTGWRLVSRSDEDDLAIKNNESSLAELVQNWQNTELTISINQVPQTEPLVVIVWLAGESTGRVFQLYAEQNTLLIKLDGRVFSAPETQLKELYPQVILDPAGGQ